VNPAPPLGLTERKLLALSSAVALLAGEAALRVAGTRPGLLVPPGEYAAFEPVERLTVDPTFFTDDRGLFRARPGPLPWAPEIVIHRDGFRGHEFVPAPAGRPSVFFLGDSFAWGASARPLTEAFPDLVERAGWHTWNGGMPGAEPDQYLAVAQRFLPVTRADAVVVTFYMGNDVMYERRELRPWQNRYHVTNAGWLNPFLDGDYLGDAQATYDYYVRRYSVPPGPTRQVFGSTALGTRLYALLHRPHPQVAARMRAARERWTGRPVSHEYLAGIEALCRRLGSRFLLVVVPRHDEIAGLRASAAPVLQGLPWTTPPLGREDFNEWPDGHLTNAGHRKVADHVLALLAEGP
jgi:hypothetical protein